jgi:hypothetical protein
MKIFVAIPSARQHANFFSANLAGLITHLNQQRIPHVIDFMFGSSLLPAARHRAIENALECNATHILCMDDDMSFNNSVFDTLLLRNVEFVGVNYVSKNYGHRPMQVQTQDMNGAPVSSIGKTGIQRVRDVGMGFVLMKADIFRSIPKPWFEVPWVTEDTGENSTGSTMRSHHLGEDYYLTRLLNHHNVPVYVDHDASRFIGHIGDMIYTEAFAVQQRGLKRLYSAANKLMTQKSLWDQIHTAHGKLPPEYDLVRDALDEITAASKWLESGNKSA